ncbi:type II secretion system protein GspG, partial [bacterium AH-315-N03]|nr:type II secretion system protein GspG [bacterium AH-315-N03]
TRTDGHTVASAAIGFIMENPGGDCPSMEDLTEGGFINTSLRTTDAWDNDFVIECDGDDITVVSPGPDGQLGGEDDIR